MGGFGAVLLDRIEAKEYKRFPVPYQQWTQDREYEKYNNICLGNVNATVSHKKLKFIDQAAYPVTNGEYTQEYLKHIFNEQEPNRKRVAWNRQTIPLLKINTPMYYAGPCKGPLAYVDIVAAWASLYMPVTLDLRFHPNPGHFMLGKIRFLENEYLLQHKLVRNAVTGIVRKDSIEFWTKRKGRHPRQSVNKFLAPELWGYMMYTIHAIAYECIHLFDCHYWNFDGAILPMDQARNMIDYLGEKWALEAIVEGESERGELTGFGSYRIGHKRTRRTFNRLAPLNNLLPYDEHLAGKLKYWRRWAMDQNYMGV